MLIGESQLHQAVIDGLEVTEMLDTKIRKFPMAEDRTWLRLNCEIDTEFIANGKLWPCEIKDLGYLGFGISSSFLLHKGDILEIVDPRTKTQVVWAADGRAGCKVFMK